MENIFIKQLQTRKSKRVWRWILQNTTVQNLILAAENVEPFKKAIEHDIHKAVNAYKRIYFLSMEELLSYAPLLSF